MQHAKQFAVIGAGLSGLTVARALADAGRGVVVFDKGRGLGGRMASRRKDGWRFDHGAIALQPTDDGFVNFVRQNQDLGCLAHWQDGDGWTGLPGMSGSVRPTAKGLTVHNQVEITGLERVRDGWVLHGPPMTADMRFDHVVLAIPQQQTHTLLSSLPDLQVKIAHAQMDPCWTLMVGFETALPSDVAYARYKEGPISVLARETSKPGRNLPGDGWVIQAGAGWSRAHLECEHAEIEVLLLAACFDALNCAPVTHVISMAHRWRYALTSKPLGLPCLNDPSCALSVCGDWCLGRTAQDAFNSGRALAAVLLSE